MSTPKPNTGKPSSPSIWDGDLPPSLTGVVVPTTVAVPPPAVPTTVGVPVTVGPDVLVAPGPGVVVAMVARGGTLGMKMGVRVGGRFVGVGKAVRVACGVGLINGVGLRVGWVVMQFEDPNGFVPVPRTVTVLI